MHLFFYLHRLLQAQASWESHMLLGSHDLPVNEPWTKCHLSRNFFTTTPSWKDTVLLLQPYRVHLPSMLGRLKPQTPNWRNTDVLVTIYITFIHTNLPEAEKLDSPAVTCVTGLLIKTSLLQCHQQRSV